MKRKILMFLICGGLVLGLATGCGSNKEEKQLNDNNSNNEQKQQESITVKEVKAVSENYAVVVGNDNLTYIIDKDGKNQGNIESSSSDKILINNEGYITLRTSGKEQTIFDKTGKVIYEKETGLNYSFGVAENGYLSRTTSKNGNIKSELIDIKGNSIKELTEYSSDNYTYEYYGNNIFGLCKPNVGSTNKESNTEYLYNVKTGNIKKIEKVNVNINDAVYHNEWKNIVKNVNDNVLKVNNYYINEDLIITNRDQILLNNKYYYDSEKKAICDIEGNSIKDLSEYGSISYIGYYNNVYSIYGNGKYTVLNQDFDKKADSIDLKVYGITKYGLLVSNSNNTSIYDFDGKKEKDFEDYLNNDVDYFITSSKSNTYYNLNTKDELVIYK